MRKILPAAVALLTVLFATSALPAAAATAPVIVKNINKAGDSSPESLTAMGDLLFFSADDGVHGRELWKSDGTAAGTQMVKDITPDGVDVGSDAPAGLTAIGDLLYFRANDGVHGEEPWVTDGTADGTRMLEVEPGSRGSDPAWFTEYNGLVYFAAATSASGNELWRTDGTTTEMVKDVTPGTGGSYPRFPTVFGGKLYFVRFDSGRCGAFGVLYRTDGTAVGTKPVIDASGHRIRGNFGNCASAGLWAVGGHLFIGRNNVQMWSSTGTRASTSKIAGFGTRLLVGLGDNAYITLFDGTPPAPTSGITRSDGTAAGTVPLEYDDASGIANSYGFMGLHVVGTGLVFWDESKGISASDGTNAGTHALNVTVFPGDDFFYGDQTTTLNSVMYFDGRASGDPGPQLWRTDGTAVGTYAVSPIYGSDLVDDVTATDSSIYFVNSGGGKGVELWRYIP